MDWTGRTSIGVRGCRDSRGYYYRAITKAVVNAIVGSVHTINAIAYQIAITNVITMALKCDHKYISAPTVPISSTMASY